MHETVAGSAKLNSVHDYDDEDDPEILVSESDGTLSFAI